MTESSRDSWHEAQQIIDVHGSDAQAECGRRAGRLVAQGSFQELYRLQDVTLKVAYLLRQKATFGVGPLAASELPRAHSRRQLI